MPDCIRFFSEGTPETNGVIVQDVFTSSPALLSSVCFQQRASRAANLVRLTCEIDIDPAFGVSCATTFNGHYINPQYSRMVLSTKAKSLSISFSNISMGLLAVVQPSDCVSK